MLEDEQNPVIATLSVSQDEDFARVLCMFPRTRTSPSTMCTRKKSVSQDEDYGEDSMVGPCKTVLTSTQEKPPPPTVDLVLRAPSRPSEEERERAGGM